MDAVALLGLVLPSPPRLAAEAPPAIGWQEAVARLAGERTRAEACAGLLRRYGDEAAKAQGQVAYGEAKAEVDGVIAGLTVALARHAEPASLPDLEGRLGREVTSSTRSAPGPRRRRRRRPAPRAASSPTSRRVPSSR